MHTERLHSAEEAADRLRAGKCVAIPTETVFGLAADATDERAIERIFKAKGRPSDNPLIVHLPNVESWYWAARTLPDTARRLLRAFAPGPITVVVPKHPSICKLVTAGLDTVGIRIPACPLAREVLRLAERPLAAPSANRSGRPSSTTWQAVLEDLDGRIDAVLCQNASTVGLESTVVDCSGQAPILLRPGAVTLEDLQQVIPATRTVSSGEGDSVRSPGLRHPHYQPRARVTLLEPGQMPSAFPAEGRDLVHLASPIDHRLAAYCGLDQPPGADAWGLIQVFPSIEAYAAGFYEFLRAADRLGLEQIVMQLAPAEQLGAALRDRQLRAAGRSRVEDQGSGSETVPER